jgi:selenocysteine-specific elongation factor
VQSLLEDEEVVALEGRNIRLTSFNATLSEAQIAVGETIRKELLAAGFEGRTAAELEKVTEGRSNQDLLAFFVREGTTVRVGKDRYYDKDELAKLVTAVLQEIERLGQVKPADLREKTGLSRKFLIPLLEWMDGQSLTVRVGDARGLGPAASNH